MSDPTQALRDDIAFLRELTQDTGASLARQGALMAGIGVIFGLQSAFYWALYEHWLPGLRAAGYWVWIAAVALFFVTMPFVVRRFPARATSAPSRAVAAAWGGIGVSMMAACMGLLIGSWRAGLHELVLWIFPIVLFTLYGAAWGVAYAVKRRAWFAWVAIGCFAAAMAEGVLVARPEQWAVLSAGLLLLVAAPGFAILRQAQAG
jgi:hypothetical protein